MSVKQCEHCGKPVIVPESVTKEQVKEIVNSEMRDICSQIPWLCNQVKELKNLMTGHPAPSENLLQQWRSCPDCASRLDRLIRQGEFSSEEAERSDAFKILW